MDRNLLKDRCQEAEVQVQAGEILHNLAVQFSSDGKWMFVCCGSNVEVYSRSSHKVVCTLKHSSVVTAALLNPRNHMQLITSSMDGKISLWDFIDNALLKTLNFGVPLLKFGIRPGNHEPAVFFVIEKIKGKTSSSEMALVGMSSHVITERSPAKPPSDQLLEAREILCMSNRPRDIKFTHQGTHLVTCSSSGKKLLIYDLENENLHSYKVNKAITSLAVHPTEPCIATGHKNGKIRIWYDFAELDTNEVVTRFHWHAHAVSDVCFTTDGTYLLSGSEEGVLVLWQLKTSYKQFRPRLGSAIMRISCSPGDAYFAVSLQSNVIQLVSGLNSEVEGTLGGLRRALTDDPEDTGMKTGLVVCPRSMSLVLNSTPGFLQFYNTEIGTVSSELNITGLNYVSRPDDKPLVPTTVDHVAFSPAADWMCTVESRDDGKTSPELRMKMWKFVTTQQRYVQNTCVDPPHDKKVTSLSFQPSISERSVPLAVTTSLDGKFKTWVLVEKEEKEEEEEEEEVGGGVERDSRKIPPPSWACRSVGYYQRLPCMGSSFSEDGSLLALNFDKSVTLWDPVSCEMRQTFSSPQRQETFRQIEFGRGTCSHYLLASGTDSLHVWDLLSCRLLWRVAVSVSHLVVDPFSFLVAAFVWCKEEDKTTLYLLDPSSPAPLAVHASVSRKPVIGAAFLPVTWETKALMKLSAGEKSMLYFINKDQVLYHLATSTDDVSSKELVRSAVGPRRGGGGMESDRNGSVIDHDGYYDDTTSASRKAFSEIIGHRKRPNGMYTLSTSSSTATRHNPPTSLINGPPHVLPPPTSLCPHFMKRLLPQSSKSKDDTQEKDSISDGNSDGGEVMVEREEGSIDSKRSRTMSSSGSTNGGDMGSDDQRRRRKGGTISSLTSNDDNTSNYEWLVDYFKSCTT